MTTLAVESTPPRSRRYRAAKRMIDVAGAALGLVVLAPFAIVVAALVAATSPGPVLFTQERVGRGGRRFRILKFRTMQVHSGGPGVTAADDARITGIGAHLRRWRIDEWPQLWCVLVGDMSLVGPRPELPHLVDAWPAEARELLAVRPGLVDDATLAALDEERELAGRPDPEAWYREVLLPRKLARSRRALREASLLTDMRTLARTVLALFTRRAAVTPDEVTHLLDRDLRPVAYDRAALRGATVLVTGAGGSLGSLLVERLLAHDVGSLLALDSSENALFRLQHAHRDERLRAVVGNVGEEIRVRRLLDAHRPSLVFHAAAHKHVPLMEDHPVEAARNNILATETLVRCAAGAGVACLVMASTDKAADPLGVMGATKRAAERMLAHNAPALSMRVVAVRLPNILGSDGSVTTLFRAQCEAGGPITVTHPRARRFFVAPSEACDLLLAAAGVEPSGVVVAPPPSEITIADLARRAWGLWGSGGEAPLDYGELRPGEKLAEVLVGASEEAVGDGVFSRVTCDVPELDLTPLREAVAAADDDGVISALRVIVPEWQR